MMKHLRMDSPTSPGGPWGTRPWRCHLLGKCAAARLLGHPRCASGPAKNRQEIDGDSIEGRARIGELMRDQKNGLGLSAGTAGFSPE